MKIIVEKLPDGGYVATVIGSPKNVGVVYSDSAGEAYEICLQRLRAKGVVLK